MSPDLAEATLNKQQITDSKVWDDELFLQSYLFMEREMRSKAELYEIFCKTIPASEDNGIALDIGSGLSTIAPKVRAKGYVYIGLDNSMSMLTRARTLVNQRANSSGHMIENLNANLLDGLPIADQSISLITAVNVLYNFRLDQLHEVLLPEIRRVLTIDGLLVMANPLPDANNMKILLRELYLRGLSFPSLKGLIADVRNNKEFLKQQGKLAKDALKLTPVEWVAMLGDHGFKSPYVNTDAYAGQASIIRMRRRD